MTSSTAGHRLGASNGIAMDSPLKDVTSNMRDMKLGASPTKGGFKGAPGRLGLSRKDRLDTVPSGSADLKVGITRDWQGPEKSLKPKVAASISVSGPPNDGRQAINGPLCIRLTLCDLDLRLPCGKMDSAATATSRIGSLNDPPLRTRTRTEMAIPSALRCPAMPLTLTSPPT
jgi:hypothetical protein